MMFSDIQLRMISLLILLLDDVRIPHLVHVSNLDDL